MKNLNFISIALLLLVCVMTVYVGNLQINSKIEECVRKNYETEIQSLKDKINKHSELINSIINLNQAQGDNTTDQVINDSANTDVEQINEFEYIKNDDGITITKYNGKQTSVQIPSYIEQMPIVKIGEYAFADSKVKSISIPSTCEEIGWFAFYGCYALTTVHISNSVEIIGYGAFDLCSKSLTIYCEKNSYANKYAQSFGISYSYIK
jgi:hypothetical protein